MQSANLRNRLFSIVRGVGDRSRILVGKEIAAVVAGSAVAVLWLLLWHVVLRACRIPVLWRNASDRDERRRRIKQLGKLKYVLLFGVLEFGVAFGLAGIVVDFIGRDSFNLGYELPKFFFYSVVFGSFMGVRNWGEFRDPVPFPPKYAQPK